MHAASSAVVHIAASLALQADTADRVATQHFHRVRQEVELHAFLFSRGDFFHMRGHVGFFAPIDDMHFRRTQPPRGTRHIDGDIAAADNGNTLACQIRRLSQGNFA